MNIVIKEHNIISKFTNCLECSLINAWGYLLLWISYLSIIITSTHKLIGPNHMDWRNNMDIVTNNTEAKIGNI